MSERPNDLEEFFRPGPDLDILEPVNEPEPPAALERLGPSPFPKGKFPFLGFLATVYDHVSAHCRARTEK